jgi:hypothetical protein
MCVCSGASGRLCCLKMMGVLLAQAPVAGRAAMARTVGWDTIWLLLAPFPVTPDLCDTLMGLGLRSRHHCRHLVGDADVSSSSDAQPRVNTAAKHLLHRRVLLHRPRHQPPSRLRKCREDRWV